MRNHRTQRSIPTRTLLIGMPMIALLAWGGLALFTHDVPPTSILAFCIVFILLGLALFCTLAPLIHLITRGLLARRIAQPTSSHAVREALLITIFLLFNLGLRVLHSWSLFTAVVSFAMIIVIELFALSGK